jgi:hypothetical protein
MSRAAVRPSDLLVECARAGVSILPGTSPGKLRMVGPSEAVKRMTPLVAQCKTALLEVLAERQATPAPEPPAPDPRLSWNHYTPANAAEIVRMAARVERAEALGLTPNEADALADRLHARDREGPQDMHACAECGWLRADATGWRCGAIRAQIPSELVTRQLQRCHLFWGVGPATNLQPR